MLIVTLLVNVFYLYLLVGLVFAIWFAFHGVRKLDPGMEGANWKLRLLILPGSVALWPVMLSKLLRKRRE